MPISKENIAFKIRNALEKICFIKKNPYFHLYFIIMKGGDKGIKIIVIISLFVVSCNFSPI